MCDLWCVKRDVWCVMRGVWWVMCDVWCVMSDVWCVMCNVRCGMCDVRCAMCDVWCVMCDEWCVMCDEVVGGVRLGCKVKREPTYRDAEHILCWMLRHLLYSKPLPKETTKLVARPKAAPPLLWRQPKAATFVVALDRVDVEAFNTIFVLRLSKTGRTVGRTDSGLDGWSGDIGGAPQCSWIDRQTIIWSAFYTNRHKQILTTSTEPSELSENLQRHCKFTIK